MPPLLLVWLSPAFPVGGFAYSHGLEWAHEAGDLPDGAALRDWISDLLAHGSGRGDAILLAAAHRAAAAGDEAALLAIAELAAALQPSAERHLEATTQGLAFLRAVSAAWPHPALDRLAVAGTAITHAVAVGVATAAHGLPLAATLEAYLLAFTQALLSAAMRLGILGHGEALRAVAALLPTVLRLAAAAEQATLEEIGGAAFRADLATLRHETQHTRLFRS